MVLYQEFPPSPALAPYLACLWTCLVLPGEQGVSHRVLPDNCIDILWQDIDGSARVAGMMTAMVQVSVLQPVRTVAVRFKPGAACHFFDFPLHEMADLHPALDELWPPGVAASFADALWSTPLDDHQALQTVQSLLLEYLRQQQGQRQQRSGAGKAPGLAQAAVAAIEGAHGAIDIASLARSLGVSRQHLASQFRERVGLGPKVFARVVRFRAASARLRGALPHELDWARLALELGYYDQPHLIHEFRALSGSTPESFLRAVAA